MDWKPTKDKPRIGVVLLAMDTTHPALAGGAIGAGVVFVALATRALCVGT